MAYNWRNMTLQNILKDLGLEEKEAKIYLALLELGEATVLTIAKKAGIKRPTAYLALGALEEKGFVSRISKGRKLFFAPQHPRKLITEAELRMKELQEVVPQLESLFHREEGKPRVMIYEGKDKLDQAYDEAFLVKGEVLFIDTHQLSYEVFPKTFKRFGYVTLSPGFRVREIFDESDTSRKFAERVRGPYYGVRFIQKEFLPFEADVGIYGNRVLISSVKKEYFTVSIESEEIAKAFRTLFEVMWLASKE